MLSNALWTEGFRAYSNAHVVWIYGLLSSLGFILHHLGRMQKRLYGCDGGPLCYRGLDHSLKRKTGAKKPDWFPRGSYLVTIWLTGEEAKYCPVYFQVWSNRQYSPLISGQTGFELYLNKLCGMGKRSFTFIYSSFESYHFKCFFFKVVVSILCWWMWLKLIMFQRIPIISPNAEIPSVADSSLPAIPPPIDMFNICAQDRAIRLNSSSRGSIYPGWEWGARTT